MCKKERAERGVALEHAVILTEFTPSWCRYPLIRFLEANGYDVAYTTCVDVAYRPNELDGHKLFISVGHDEYWSGAQRRSVTEARDHGLHLAFLSGNEVYWKTRCDDF